VNEKDRKGEIAGGIVRSRKGMRERGSVCVYGWFCRGVVGGVLIEREKEREGEKERERERGNDREREKDRERNKERERERERERESARKKERQRARE